MTGTVFPLIVFHDDRMIEHDPGRGHPERPERLVAVRDALRGSAVPIEWRTPRAATRDDVGRVHTPEHIGRIDALRGRAGALDPDTRVSPRSVEAAYLAAGAAIEAVESIGHATPARAIALGRPPGHHAESDRAMGFCLFSNAAVAAAHALAAGRAGRVLIVDWDVHHGNGTQQIFLDRGDVLYFSSHRAPFYPGTGALDEVGRGPGTGFTVNVPFPAGTGDEVFTAIYRHMLPPLVETYRPDLIIASAGFDAHARDPLGGCAVTDDAFAAVCGVVRDLADRHAAGRLALVLEGGYDLPALASGMCRCAEVLTGGEAPGLDGSAMPHLVRDAMAFHAKWWPGLA